MERQAVSRIYRSGSGSVLTGRILGPSSSRDHLNSIEFEAPGCHPRRGPLGWHLGCGRPGSCEAKINTNISLGGTVEQCDTIAILKIRDRNVHMVFLEDR